MPMTAADASAISARNNAVRAAERAAAASKTADVIIQNVERSIAGGGDPCLRLYSSYTHDYAVQQEVNRKLTAAGFTVGKGGLGEIDWPGRTGGNASRGPDVSRNSDIFVR